MANEREGMTAMLKAVNKEEKRTVYVFEDPENPEKEKKYSAFPPRLPELAIGKTYRFMVEHKSRGDGTFHHNLVRDGYKDGPYMIEEVEAGFGGKGSYPAGPDPKAPLTLPKTIQSDSVLIASAMLASAIIQTNDMKNLDKALEIFKKVKEILS